MCTPSCLPASQSQRLFESTLFQTFKGTQKTKMCTPNCLPTSQSPRLLGSTLLETFNGPKYKNAYSQLPSRFSGARFFWDFQNTKMCTPSCLTASQSSRLLGGMLFATFEGPKYKNVHSPCFPLPRAADCLGVRFLGLSRARNTKMCAPSCLPAYQNCLGTCQGPNTKMCTPSCLPASQSPRLLCSMLLGTFKGPNHQNVYSQLPSRFAEPQIV